MNPISWRDRQISGLNFDPKNITILQQEKIMLDFMDSCQGAKWKWLGDANNLREFCRSLYKFDEQDYNGVVMFGGIFFGKPTSHICKIIENHIAHVDYAYCAINRYQISCHDMEFDLPDSIEDSIDAIVRHCDPRFQRLHTFAQVDGDHMVAAHPLDCYALCK